MSDERLLELFDSMRDMPRLIDGRRKYVHLGTSVLVFDRVGQGERWAFAPSRGQVALEDGMVPAARAYAFSTAALRWVYRGARMDVGAHARAMGARTL